MEPKYKINDDVAIQVLGQFGKGRITYRWKSWLGTWKYKVRFNVQMYDEGRYVYTEMRIKTFKENKIYATINQ